MERLRVALAMLGLAAGISACNTGTRAEEGEATLAIYVSAPLTGPGRADGQDVAKGARMALADAGGEAGGYAVFAEYLDVAGRNEIRFDPVTAAANARAATEDSTTIAYIGELDSGATRSSLPITNSAGILQVAPGSGASDLVRDETYNDEVPSEVQGTGERTFARLVPGDGEVGSAAARLIHDELDIGTALASGQGRYGDEVLDGFESEASFVGLEVDDVISGGVALFRADDRIGELGVFVGDPPATLPSAANLLGSAALIFTDAILASSPRPPRGVLVVSAHLDPSELPPDGERFVDAFKEEFGRKPGRYAAYGYEAMASILAAMDRADDPADRGSVVDAYFDGTERASVLGTYEIAETGETTLGALSGYELSPVGELTPKVALSPSG